MKGPRVQPPNRPNGSTYWVSDSLMAGEYPASNRGVEETRKKIQNYLNSGITFFVDLCHERERENYKKVLEEEAAIRNIKVTHTRFPINDFGIPSKDQMKSILDTIDNAINNNEKVYVHCRAGIGRTGTVIGCYLARHGNSGTEALAEVNRLFQFSDKSEDNDCSPESTEQMDFVKNWHDK